MSQMCVLNNKKYSYKLSVSKEKIYKITLTDYMKNTYTINFENVDYPKDIKEDEITKWIEEELLKEYKNKLNEYKKEFDFEGHYSEYINLKDLPNDSKCIFNYTKKGADLLSLINRNPKLFDRIKDDNLKDIVSKEIPSILSQKDVEFLTHCKNQDFYYRFVNTDGLISGVVIKPQDGPEKEYKLSINKIRESLVWAKRLSAETMVNALKTNLKLYDKIAIEAIINYNIDLNRIYNKDFQIGNLNNLIIYKKPKLSDTIEYYANKRVIEYAKKLEKEKLEKMSDFERKEYYEKNKKKVPFENIDFSVVDSIIKKAEKKETIDKEETIVEKPIVNEESVAEDKETLDEKIEKNKKSLADRIEQDGYNIEDFIEELKTKLNNTIEKLSNIQLDIKSGKKITMSAVVKAFKEELFRTLDIKVPEKTELVSKKVNQEKTKDEQIKELQAKINRQEEMLDIIYESLPIEIMEKINIKIQERFEENDKSIEKDDLEK